MDKNFMEDLKSKTQKQIRDLKTNPALLNLKEKFPFLKSVLGQEVVEKKTHASPEVDESNQDKTGKFNAAEILNEEMTESSEEVSILKNPEKRKKLLYVLAILGVVWLLFEEEEVTPPPVIQPKVKQAVVKTPPKNFEVKKEVIPQKEEVKEVVMEEKSEEKIEESIAIPPVEEVTVQIEEEVSPQPVEEVVETNTEVRADNIVSQNEAEIEAIETARAEEQVTEEQTTEEVAEQDMVGESENPLADDSLTSENVLMELEEKLKEKKAKQEEQIVYATPRYTVKGRGLVYSCKGKHWACVNGENYSKCEKNYNYHQYVKRPSECYPDSVYQSSDDCGMAHQNKIDTNA